MTADEPRKKVSKTEDVEYGYYIRKRTRYGKRRRQKTTRIKRNPNKVTLGKLGTLEFYAYPDQYPDKVFYGIYPLSDYMEEHQKEDILRIYNKIKWYFSGEPFKKPKRSDKANVARKTIQRAYNHSAHARRDGKKGSDSLN